MKHNHHRLLSLLVTSLLCLALTGCNTDTVTTDNTTSPIPLNEQTSISQTSAPDGYITLIKATYVRTIDGDTIKVIPDGESEEKSVRLIGVNTLESVSSNESENNEYGKMASDFTTNYLTGASTVWLEYDEQTQDQYGRELAYVWLSDNIDPTNPNDIAQQMYNGILLSNGQAYDIIYEPNHKYADTFAKICQNAKDAKTGLWQYNEFWTLVNKKLNN